MSKDQSTIVIASAARTPVGAFNGALASLPAHELGKIAIKAALERARVEPGEVSEVILGQILAAGAGQNPARQASINAGIPVDAPAWGMNQLCGSGLRAVALGAQQIELGSSKIVVAGGQESMSQAPHCAHLREGTKMGDIKFIDTMIKDGLWDAFNGYHMGTTAENVARQWQITREEQDRFAVASQNKAEAAKKAGKFKDEIAPVTIKTRKGETVVCRRRVHQGRRDLRLDRQAAAGLRQGRHRDGRQRQRHQRWRGGGRAHDAARKPSGAASRRSRASCPGRTPASIPRSWARGPSPPPRRRWRRPAGPSRTST